MYDSETSKSDHEKIPRVTIPSLHPHDPSFPLIPIMKISKKIEQSTKEGKIWWSFEYFPPRTAQVCIVSPSLDNTTLIALALFQGLQNLLDRIERMRALGPEFIDITWQVSFLVLRMLLTWS